MSTRDPEPAASTPRRSAARAVATSAARASIKAAAIGRDLLRHPPAGIVVLIYHRVGHGSGGQMDVDTGTFDRQLAWLVDHTRLITLDDAVEELLTATPDLPTRPGVVLTFDDGTTDWVDHVLPALDRHGVPATFYVATDFVERSLPFPGDGRPIGWAALRDLASSPLVTIGSHTHRHLLLDRLRRDDIAEELDRSIELLADHLGTAPRHFAYPKAVAGSPAADREVRNRFSSAVVAGTRPNLVGTDVHLIQRSPIQQADGPAAFRHKAAGGMGLEDDLRRLANRVRYRRATS